MKSRDLWPLVALSISAAAAAQTTHKVGPLQVVVGSDDDNYLRYLQTAGIIPEYPWSIRAFSPQEISRLAFPVDSQPRRSFLTEADPSVRVHSLPIVTALRFNSAFPYGSNDGAIWAGRGLTSSMDGGISIRLKAISIVLDPVFFRAENRAFGLFPNGQSGILVYADPLFPRNVDRPQRFGNAAYGRGDFGQSELRVDLLGLTGGISTADMGWGPMQQYEFILSGNAPGFPHIFFGTSTPRNIFVGHLHARLIWGELEQSAYSPVQGTSYYSSSLETGTRRFASGLVLAFQPRGIPGLEVGAARFFHSLWPKEGPPLAYFTKPFSGVLKRGLPTLAGLNDSQGGTDNQLASAFARWVFPHSGFEFYGEYGHEDFNYDLRDLVQEPDHSRSYGLGFRKVIGLDSLHLNAIRAEMINYQLPTLARNRAEGSVYDHFLLAQGHTNRGQVLGADAGIGTGAASTIAWDHFYRDDRLSLIWSRMIRQEEGSFSATGLNIPRSMDVLTTLGIERTHTFHRIQVTTAATIVREFNRDFASDAWNLNSIVSLSYHFGH
jgi:hypothetical protein